MNHSSTASQKISDYTDFSVLLYSIGSCKVIKKNVLMIHTLLAISTLQPGLLT